MIAHKLTFSESPFQFEAGGHLDSIDVVFHTSKGDYTPGRRVVWICHALTANSDVEEWWPDIAGPGKAIDPDKDYVVCVNMLCSAYGSMSASSINPRSGKPFFFDFPATTVRDMISASILVRKKLGIDHIDLLIGSSIGGFQAIEWAITEPDIIRNALFMATAPRISPWLGSTVATQRMALEADQTFRQCNDLSGGSEGLKCARAQALVSYRCYSGYQLTQKEDDVDCLFAGKVASYEKYQGEKFIKRKFDAYSYYYLCQALDSHNVGRNRGGVAAALNRIKARTIVASIDTDVIFPPFEFDGWAGCIPNVEIVRMTSNFGHDGFLLEKDQICNILEMFDK